MNTPPEKSRAGEVGRLKQNILCQDTDQANVQNAIGGEIKHGSTNETASSLSASGAAIGGSHALDTRDDAHLKTPMKDNHPNESGAEVRCPKPSSEAKKPVCPKCETVAGPALLEPSTPHKRWCENCRAWFDFTPEPASEAAEEFSQSLSVIPDYEDSAISVVEQLKMELAEARKQQFEWAESSDGYSKERDQLRADVLRLEKAELCDICGGSGTPVSGKPCACNGSGKMAIAMVTARQELYDYEKRLQQIKELAEQIPLLDLGGASDLAEEILILCTTR